MRKAWLLSVVLAAVALPGWSLAEGLAPGLPAPAGTSSSPPQGATIEVRVVGERKRRPDRTADVVAIAGEKLRESPSATLLEALAHDAPDLYVPARGAGIHGVASGATGGIHLRGLGGSPTSQVVVIEDGVPDYQGLFGHPIPDAYTPFLLEDAMVVRGGDSVLYGTNAMGGAILLRSRWRRREGWELESDSSIGSFDTIRHGTAVLGETGRWGFAGGLSALRTDGHRLGAGGSSLIGQFAVRARPGVGWELVLRQKALHLTGADPGPVTHPTPDHSYDVWRDRVSLQASWRAAGVDIRLHPFFNVGRHELYDGFVSVDTTSGAIVESELRPHPALTVVTGTAVDRADGRAENRVTDQPLPLRAQQSVSLYQQVTAEPIEALQVVAGARGVASPNNGLILLYKGGFRYALAEGWHLRGRVARNFRQPTLSELYLPFPTSNPGLKPERSLTTDAGGGYAGRFIALSATWYRSEIDDLIKYFGAWPSAEVVNIDHTTVVGIEAHAALREVGPFTLRAGGDWQDVGRYTRQNPSARGVFTVEFEQPLSAWTLRAAVEGEWVHGLYMSNYARDPLDDVFVLNLSVRARRSLDDRAVSMEPYLVVRNVLDRRYAYVKDYAMPGVNGLVGLKLVL